MRCLKIGVFGFVLATAAFLPGRMAQAQYYYSGNPWYIVARSNLPRPLGSHALDPVTGRIAWPEALQNGVYTAYRTQLEQLFAQRLQRGHAAGTAARIHTVTAELAEQLRRHIEEVPAKEYMSSRTFLDSLDYAAHNHAG